MISILLFALLFVVFDISPYTSSPGHHLSKLGWAGFESMLVFIGVLFFGLIYTWRRGALKWEK